MLYEDPNMENALLRSILKGRKVTLLHYSIDLFAILNKLEYNRIAFAFHLSLLL